MGRAGVLASEIAAAMVLLLRLGLRAPGSERRIGAFQMDLRSPGDFFAEAI